jgi:hypothetical protein
MSTTISARTGGVDVDVDMEDGIVPSGRLERRWDVVCTTVVVVLYLEEVNEKENRESGSLTVGLLYIHVPRLRRQTDA